MIRKYPLAVQSIFVGILYLLSYLILTYPLILNMDNAIYGVPHDNLGSLWNIWSFQIVQNGASMTSFPYLEYPKGIDLTNRMFTYLSDGLDYIFAWLAPNARRAWNMIYLFKLTMASLSGFFLFRYITNSTAISWALGLAYAINPYMSSISKAYGYYYLSMFLPVLFLALLNALEKLNPKSMTLLLITVCLFATENYYYTYHSFTVLALTLASLLFLDLGLKASTTNLRILPIRWSPKSVTILSFISILASRTAYTLKRFFDTLNPNKYPRSTAIDYRSDHIFDFIPAMDHFLFGEHLEKYYWTRKGVLDTFEMSTYWGYWLILAIALTLLFQFSKKIIPSWRFLFFLCVFLYSFMFSFGPIDGNLFWFNRFFYDLAPMFRHTSRYQLILILSLLMMGAYGLTYLKRSLGKIPSLTIPTILVGLIIFEYNSFGPKYVLNFADQMPKAYQLVTKDQSAEVIVDIPNKWWRARSYYLAYQTFHEKKLPYHPLKDWNFDIYNLDDHKKLIENHIDYLVVNKQLPPLTMYPFSPPTGPYGLGKPQKVAQIGHLELVSEFEDSLLYKVTSKNHGLYNIALLKSGFYMQHDLDTPYKWTSDMNSEIAIQLADNHRPFTFEFKARSLTPKHIDVYYNQKVIYSFTTTSSLNEYSFKMKATDPSAILKLRLKNELDPIWELTGSSDHRSVGIYIGELTVKLNSRKIK